MDDVFLLAMLAAGGALALAFWIGRRRFEAARREALKRAARRLALDFGPPVDGPPDDGLAGLRVLGRGRSRKATAVMRGAVDGREALVFDWQCTVGAGKDSRRERRTLCAFRRADGPAFELRPETILHRIGAALGRRDIDFDDDPGFSRKYELRGPDEDAVRTLFRRSARRALERSPGWHAEAEGQWIAWWRRRRPKPDELRAYALEAARLHRELEDA